MFRPLPSCAVLLLVLPTVAVAQTKGHLLQTGDVMIYYETLGSKQGTPLIVINGGPGFDHTYLQISPVWDLLSKTRPVVLYDQRGNGRSSKVRAGDSCTLEDQISDLDALRSQLGADKVDLLGHSWGGFLGMAYASKYPQHVVHLALVDSVPARWSDIEPIYQQVFPDVMSEQKDLAGRARAGDKTASSAALRAYLSTLFYSPEKRDAFLRNLSVDAVNNDVMNVVVKSIATVDLAPSIETFPFPTLIANGRFDTDITPAVAFKLHQTIPNSGFVIFEKSGHFPFYEESDKFLHTMEAFLNN